MRLIDADKLKDKFEEIQKNRCKSLVETVFFDGVLAILDEQPTISKMETTTWTLCSEALPKETGYYLIKNEADRIEYLWFMKSTNTWCLFNSTMKHNHVVKWKEVE